MRILRATFDERAPQSVSFECEVGDGHRWVVPLIVACRRDEPESVLDAGWKVDSYSWDMPSNRCRFSLVSVGKVPRATKDWLKERVEKEGEIGRSLSGVGT